MQHLQFPIRFQFKISTLANDFTATDALGNVVAYVRQKMFKLKEEIEVYADESRSTLNYRIRSDRWIDFSAVYSFYDRQGSTFGKVARKGWRSVWKAEYEVADQHDRLQYHIREENGWVKVMDSVLGEIPVLGLLTGYFFNPTYLVTDLDGRVIVKLIKQPSFFGREFLLERVAEIDADDKARILLALMMMILLERRRG